MEEEIVQKLLVTVREFSGLGYSELISNPEEMLFVVEISKEHARIVDLEDRVILVSRKVLKHITEQRGSKTEEIVRKMPYVLCAPTKIVDNSIKKLNSYLFVRILDEKGVAVVIEITKTPRRGEVVSAFPVDNKTYRKMIDISGRAEFPPYEAPKGELSANPF